VNLSDNHIVYYDTEGKEHFPFHHFSNRIYLWYFKMLKQVERGLTHISEQNSKNDTEGTMAASTRLPTF
jgi:hypothetical protein